MPRTLIPGFVCVLLIATILAPGQDTANKVEWKTLAPGMDVTVFKAAHVAPPYGDAQITVLRIDPALWDLEFAGSAQSAGAETHTAREWCAKRNFVAAINAGMFRAEGESHVGYTKHNAQLYSKTVTSYRSLAAFGPADAKRPRFRMFDLENPRDEIPSISTGHILAVQNLRMIQRPRINRWRQDNRRWSQAALGEDKEGRILFIFARSPLSVYEMNEELLAADIGLVAAQYLEGGPEAQLYVHAAGTEMEMVGAYGTASQPSDDKASPWAIPNVLGIRARKK